MKMTKKFLSIVTVLLLAVMALTACNIGKKEKKEPIPEKVDSVSVLNLIYNSIGKPNLDVGAMVDIQMNIKTDKEYTFVLKAGGDAVNAANSKMVMELTEVGKDVPEFGIYYENSKFYFNVSGNTFYISEFNLAKILQLGNVGMDFVMNNSIGQMVLSVFLPQILGIEMTVTEKNGVQTIDGVMSFSGIQPVIKQLLDKVFPGGGILNYDDILGIPGAELKLKNILNDELKAKIVSIFDGIPKGNGKINAVVDHGVLTVFNIDGDNFKGDAVNMSVTTYNAANVADLDSKMPEFVNYTKFDFAVYEFVTEFSINDNKADATTVGKTVDLLAVIQFNLDIKDNMQNRIVIDIKNKKDDSTLLKLYYLKGIIYVDATNALKDVTNTVIDFEKLGLPKLKLADTFDLAKILNDSVGGIIDKIMAFVGNDTKNGNVAPIEVTSVDENGKTTTEIDVSAVIMTLLDNMKFEDGTLNLHLANDAVRSIVTKLLGLDHDVTDLDVIDLFDKLGESLPVPFGQLIDGLLKEVGFSIERILKGIGIDGEFKMVEKRPELGVGIIFEGETFGNLSLALTEIGSLKNPLAILSDEEMKAYKLYEAPKAVNISTTLTIPNTPFTIKFNADIDRVGKDSMLKGDIIYNKDGKSGSIKFVYETENGEIFLDFTKFMKLLPKGIDLTGLGFPYIRITAKKVQSAPSETPSDGEKALMEQIIAIFGTLVEGMKYDKDGGILNETFELSGISRVLETFGVNLSDVDKMLGDAIGGGGLDFVQKYLGTTVYEFIESIMPLVVTISKSDGLDVDISIKNDITVANFTLLKMDFNNDFIFENKENYTQADLAKLEWISVKTKGNLVFNSSEAGDALISKIISKLIGDPSFLGDVKVELGTKKINFYLEFELALNLQDMSKSQMILRIVKAGVPEISLISITMDGDTIYVDLGKNKNVKVKITDTDLFGETPSQFYERAYESYVEKGNDVASFAASEMLGQKAWERLITVIFEMLDIPNTPENKLTVWLEEIGTDGHVQLTAMLGNKIALTGVMTELDAAYTPVVDMTDAGKQSYIPISLNPEENIATMLPIIIPMIMPDFAVRLLNNSSEADYYINDDAVNKITKMTNGFKITIDPQAPVSMLAGLITLNPKFSIELTSAGVAIKITGITQNGGEITVVDLKYDALSGSSGNTNPPIFDKTTGQVGQVTYPIDKVDGQYDAPELLGNAYSEQKNEFTYKQIDKTAAAYDIRVFYPNRRVFNSTSNTITDVLRTDAYQNLTAVTTTKNSDGTVTVKFGDRAIKLLETYEIQVRAAASITEKKEASEWTTIRYDDNGGIKVKSTVISQIENGMKMRINLDPLMLQKMLDNIQASLVRGMLAGTADAAKYYDDYAYYGTGLNDGLINDIYKYLNSNTTFSGVIGLLDATQVKTLISRLIPFGRIVDIAYLDVEIVNGVLTLLELGGGVADANGNVIKDNSTTNNVLYSGNAEAFVLTLIGKGGTATDPIVGIGAVPNVTYDKANISTIVFNNGIYVPSQKVATVNYSTNGQYVNAKIFWNQEDLAKVKIIIGEKKVYDVRYKVAGIEKTQQVTIDGTFGFETITAVEPVEQNEIPINAYSDRRAEKLLPKTINVVIKGTVGGTATELTVAYPTKWDISEINFDIGGGNYTANTTVVTVGEPIIVTAPIKVSGKTITGISMLTNGAGGDYTTTELNLPLGATIDIDPYKPFTFKGYSIVTFSDGTTAIAAGEWDISAIKYTSVGGKYTVTYLPKYFLSQYGDEKIWTATEYPIISYSVNAKAHKVSGIEGFVKEGEKFVLYINNPLDPNALKNELVKWKRSVTYDDGCVMNENIVWGDVAALGWTFKKGLYDGAGNEITPPDFTGKNAYGVGGMTQDVTLKVKDMVSKNIKIAVRELKVTSIDGFSGMTYNAPNPFNLDFILIMFKSQVTGTLSNAGYTQANVKLKAEWDATALTSEIGKVYGLGGKTYNIPVKLTDSAGNVFNENVTVTFPDVKNANITLHYNDEAKTALTELMLNPKDPDFVMKIPKTVFISDGTNFYEMKGVIWTDDNGIPYILSNLNKNGTYPMNINLGFDNKKVTFTLKVDDSKIAYYKVGETVYNIEQPFYVNPYNAPNMKWNVIYYNTDDKMLFSETINWKLGDFKLTNIAGGTKDIKHHVEITDQTLTLKINVYKATFETIKVNGVALESNTFNVNPLVTLANKLPRDFTITYKLHDTTAADATKDTLYDVAVNDYQWTFNEADTKTLSNYLDGGTINTYKIKTHEFGEDCAIIINVEQYGALTTPNVEKDKTFIIGETVSNKIDTITVNFATKGDVNVAKLNWGIAAEGLKREVFDNVSKTYSLTVFDTVMTDVSLNYTIHFVTLLTPNRYEVQGAENNMTYFYKADGTLASETLVLPTTTKMAYLDSQTKEVAFADVGITPNATKANVGSNETFLFEYEFDVTVGTSQYKGKFAASIYGATNYVAAFTATTEPYTIWKNITTEDATYTIDLSKPMTFFASSFPTLYFKQTTAFTYNTTPNLNYKVISEAIITAYNNKLRTTMTIDGVIRMKIATGLFGSEWKDVKSNPLTLTIVPLR